MRYRLKPSRLTSNATIPFGNDEIFIQALYAKVLQYLGDPRATNERLVLEQLLARYFGGANKSPIKGRAVRLNADTFKGIQNYR